MRCSLATEQKIKSNFNDGNQNGFRSPHAIKISLGGNFRCVVLDEKINKQGYSHPIDDFYHCSTALIANKTFLFSPAMAFYDQQLLNIVVVDIVVSGIRKPAGIYKSMGIFDLF